MAYKIICMFVKYIKDLHFSQWPLHSTCYCLPISSWAKSLWHLVKRFCCFIFFILHCVPSYLSLYLPFKYCCHSHIFLKSSFFSSWGHLADRIHLYSFTCHLFLLCILNISIISFLSLQSCYHLQRSHLFMDVSHKHKILFIICL